MKRVEMPAGGLGKLESPWRRRNKKKPRQQSKEERAARRIDWFKTCKAKYDAKRARERLVERARKWEATLPPRPS